MKKNSPWSEVEIRGAISSYFELLDAQLKNKRINKSQVYRNFSFIHSTRSPKAIEFKFQNISAVLYEEKLPYV